MPAIITDKFRILNAKLFVDSFNTSNIFLFAGRVKPWAGTATFPGADDSTPPIPLDSDMDSINLWDEMVAAKYIGSSNVKRSIRKEVWVSGTVYDQYDSGEPNLLHNKFYVSTVGNERLYKCLFRPLDINGVAQPSTIQPSGTSTSHFVLGDGYIWKYMFEPSGADALLFVTPSFVPVIESPAVKAAAIQGEIFSCTVQDPGVGYVNPTVTIEGDGTGATATIVISGGGVVSVNMVTFGSGYTYANVKIVDGAVSPSNAADVYASISPGAGHGDDLYKELGAFYVTITNDFNADESGTFNIVNDYRTIGLLKDPLLPDGNPFVGAVAKQIHELTLATSNSNSFLKDEIIDIFNVTNDVIATATIVNNSETDTLGINDVVGDLTDIHHITGRSSIITGSVSGSSNPDMKKYSGTILYIEQRTPIVRALDQIERFSITLEW